MEETISADQASRDFYKLLRQVRTGQSFVITEEGKPIARIVPLESAGARDAAKASLLARLRSQPAMNLGPWTREELYEDSPPQAGP
jgi:prevent-host-death family protein